MIERVTRRPVAVLMATAALAVLGIPTALRMPLELMPDVSFPRLAIHVSWPGASPEMVEARVTAPIERAAQRVRGVTSVASTSYPQRSEVAVEFEPGTDMEFARLALSEELATLAAGFPPGASSPPEVQAWVPEEFASETEALLVWTMAGPGAPGSLRDLAIDLVRPALLAVDGVDAVEVSGGTDRELQVELDPDRLAAFGISPDDVAAALAEGLDVSETAATVEERGRAWTVTIEDRAGSAADVEELVVRPAAVDSMGSFRPPVLLGDLGRARVARARPASLHRVDRRSAVTVSLYRAAGSNAIRVAGAARERAALLEAEALPPEYHLLVDRDGSERIREELSDLAKRSVVAALVVLTVLLVAFRRIEPALLAFTAIGTSVAIALAVMGWSGLTLNLLTLAGLAMGLGLVVDNAIVVLESGERRRAAGEPPGEAAAAGAREVALPLLAATATTAIVFLPFLYFQGELRAYYLPFAATVAVVLAVSLAVSLVALPAAVGMLSERVGRAPRRPPTPTARRGRAIRFYRGILSRTIQHPKATVVAAFLLLAVALWLFQDRVPRGRTWAGFGESTYLVVHVEMPHGAELERTDGVVLELERDVAAIPSIERFTTRVSPQHGSIRIDLPDSLQASSVPLIVKEELVARSHHFGGAEVRVHGFGPSFYGGGGVPPTYRLEIRGYAWRELEAIALDLAAGLQRHPRIRDVDPNATGHWYERDRETELALVPDRVSLAGTGMSVAELLGRVSAYTRGRSSADIVSIGGEEMDLSLKLAGADSADVTALADLVVTTAEGLPVRVADVARLEERETMARIVREDQRYQRVVAYEFRGPPKLGDAVREAVVASTSLPPGYEILSERGWWELAEGESRQIGLALALAVTLVFLVTAALFESLRAPLVVLAAVPLALIGVAALWLITGDTFTREAWIGVVMMAGIVVNNAILVVDRIGILRREGRELMEAALKGTLQRVRPVLMTTATTVLGLLPFVLWPDSGESGLWRSLAMATIGGLLVSTGLVLVTLPALYLLVHRVGAREKST